MMTYNITFVRTQELKVLKTFSEKLTIVGLKRVVQRNGSNILIVKRVNKYKMKSMRPYISGCSLTNTTRIILVFYVWQIRVALKMSRQDLVSARVTVVSCCRLSTALFSGFELATYRSETAAQTTIVQRSIHYILNVNPFFSPNVSSNRVIALKKKQMNSQWQCISAII